MIRNLYEVSEDGKLQLRLHRGQSRAWESKKRFVFVLAGTQGGKALDIDTPIPTPNGFVRMSDLKVGDMVLGSNGKPCQIIFASPVMHNRKCYRVEFDDGSSLIADGDHLWKTQTYKQRKNSARRILPKEDFSIVATIQIANSLLDFRGSNNHSIAISGPAEYQDANLPIPPYTLGAWLGDGTSTAAAIHTADREVVDAIASEGISVSNGKRRINQGKALTYYIGSRRASRDSATGRMVSDGSSLHSRLRLLGVLGNKHIPEIYLTASVQQRMALLHGLMDTDGYCDVDGGAEYTSTNFELACDVLELLRSLGIKARMNTGRAMLYGKDCGPKYRIIFTTSRPVFSLRRKLERLTGGYRADLKNRYVVSITEVESVPVRCIGVDNPDHLYLAGRDYIVTHNTSFGPFWLWREIQRNGPGDYLAVTSTFPLLRLKMLPEFLKVFHNTLHLGKWWAADRVYELANPETGEMAGRATDPMWGRVIFGSAKNADSLESATAKAAWLDEVGQNQFRVDAWEAILRRLSLNRGRVLGTTTLYNWGWMKQQIYDPWKRGEDTEIEIAQFKSIENPSFPRDEYYRAKRTMPRWKFKMFYEGEYDKPAGMIYDAFDFNTQVIPAFNIPYGWPLYVGIDFGGVHMAGIFTAQNPETKAFYHFHEYLDGGKSISQHAEAFKRIVGDRPFSWIGGAAPEDQWRTEFREAGIPVLPPPIKDVEVGIQRVYGYHRRNQIFVFSTLSRYLDQKGSYARKLNDMNQPTDQIEDKNAYHLMDAERVLFAHLWEYQGGPNMDIISAMGTPVISKWALPRPTVIMTESSGGNGGRWQRGRKF